MSEQPNFPKPDKPISYLNQNNPVPEKKPGDLMGQTFKAMTHPEEPKSNLPPRIAVLDPNDPIRITYEANMRKGEMSEKLENDYQRDRELSEAKDALRKASHQRRKEEIQQKWDQFAKKNEQLIPVVKKPKIK